MAESTDRGVVDKNCRMFGSENLFIAGSSVFPGGGHANPTFTIAQLALRLADHLAALRRA
jgi:choline dehydrogenase-like flavoprotein